MESERRGPPCFTLGLRLLFDTFELIRGSRTSAARRLTRLAGGSPRGPPPPTAAQTNTTFVGEHPAVPLPYTPGRPGQG